MRFLKFTMPEHGTFANKDLVTFKLAKNAYYRLSFTPIDQSPRWTIVSDIIRQCQDDLPSVQPSMPKRIRYPGFKLNE